MPLDTNTILTLIAGTDRRTAGMMPGWDMELACQKILFFTAPGELVTSMDYIIEALDAGYSVAARPMRERIMAFTLSLAESLSSPVELHHNLQNHKLHGEGIISDIDAIELKQSLVELLRRWSGVDNETFWSVTTRIKAEDLAVNKGDNVFAAWARKWQDENVRDPYDRVGDYLACFEALYQPGMYYPDLFFARENGLTKTQFFNDYGLHATRCRRMGSLGGTTNPAIAVMGEDDLSGIGNIWGPGATDFIRQFPNKWHEVRRDIAQQQVSGRHDDEWAATRFTEWVVVDAMLGLRSIFLLKGLGRVAFQLRPDWHDDEEKLTRAGGQIYKTLCERVSVFDRILLENSDTRYADAVGPRVGKANNHFKIACTGQACLNTVRIFNAGFSEAYPDALTERMFTNVTLSYEVSQMYAASVATEQGIRDYERRTGEKVDDGEGGSVVTSMIGRFNDSIRSCRVMSLLASLPDDSPFKAIDPASIKLLTDPSINNADFIAALKAAGVDFDPEPEEDAIDRAGTLCTKRAVVLLEKNEGLARTRILTASKRNFFQNTELLDVPFSTDFGNVQRMVLDVMPLEIDNWKTLYEDMDESGYPIQGSVWAARGEILVRIWPEWPRVFEADGVAPEDYANTIYVPPTLDQFIGFWKENVARAAKYAEEARQ